MRRTPPCSGTGFLSCPDRFVAERDSRGGGIAASARWGVAALAAVDSRGCEAERYRPRQPPVVLLDWDNTLVKNDVGDAITSDRRGAQPRAARRDRSRSCRGDNQRVAWLVQGPAWLGIRSAPPTRSPGRSPESARQENEQCFGQEPG